MRAKNLSWVIVPFIIIAVVLGTGAQDTHSEPLTGTIDGDTPFVEVPLTIDRSNQTLTLDLKATSGDLDTFLYLVDSNGRIIYENDDREPGNLDAKIIYEEIAAGDYVAIATRLGGRSGDTTGEYTLDVAIEPTETAETIDYGLSPDELSAAGFPTLDTHPTAEWTIFAYYGGDTDLEPDVLNDFNEFELAGGSDETVRIVALVDRHPDFTDASGNWASARIFEVEADVSGDEMLTFPPTLDTEPLVDLGPRNSGSSELFAQFLTWGLTHYPAQRYAVAFASHGAGWRGIIGDDTADAAILTLPDLQAAFAAATEATGVDRFDVLVNDACFMSSIEYFQLMSDYFTYSLASPEIVVNPALDMTLFTDLLRSDPDMPLREVGRDLVDTYIDRDVAARDGSEGAYMAHAITELTGFNDVIESTERFANIVNFDPGRYATLIGQARTNAYTYARFLGNTDKIDLGHFMQQVIALSTDIELVQAAQQVIEALENTRLYEKGGRFVENRISYYNIYFPEDSRDFELQYLRDTNMPEWGRMLRNYYNEITPRLWQADDSLLTYHPPVAPQVKVTRVYPQRGSSAIPPAVSVEIVGRRIASGSFTVDRVDREGDLIRLAEQDILTEVVAGNTIDYVNSWKSGVDRSVFNWLPLTLPAVTDGFNLNYEFLKRVNDLAALEGQYRTPGSSEWNEVTVLFELNGRIRNVISESRSGAVASIDIAAGSEFQTFQQVVTVDGVTRREIGNTYIWPPGGLMWREEPTPSGTYNLGFYVESFGGSIGWDSVQVRIDNTFVDPYWTGYTDMNLGFTFQRPAQWSAVGDFGDNLYTVNDDETAALNIYYFRALENNFAIAREVQRQFALQRVSSAETFTLDGAVGLIFDHTYRTRDGNIWLGRAVALYRETALGGRGIVFSVDVVPGADNAPDLDQLFPRIMERIDLFDASALRRQDTGDWSYAFIDRTIAYPVRNDWFGRETDMGGLRAHIYRPQSNPQGYTQATIAQLPGDAADDATAALNTVLSIIGTGDDATLRPYQGEFHNWESAYYTREVSDATLAGRVYVTRLNNRFIVFRAETVDDETAPSLFRTVFEPMLDGIAPPSNVTYAGGGAQSSLVRASVITALDACGDMARDTICVPGSSRAEATHDSATVADDSLDGLNSIEIGRVNENTVDPYSIAVLDLQANLPDDTNQDIKLLAFGGATLINQSPPVPGERREVTMVNRSGEIKRIRTMPAQDAPTLGALEADESVIAVGRTEDRAWVRVRLPDDPAKTGWVFKPLLESIDEEHLLLPVSDPALPHLFNMQSIEVLLDENAADALFQGILVQVGPGNYTANLVINGAVFEIAADTQFFWEGDLQSQAISDNENFAQTTSKRRPGAWSSSVVQGSVRVRLTDPNTTGASVVTSIPGLQVAFDENQGDNNGLAVQSAESGGAAAALLTSPLSAALSPEEVEEFQRALAIFNSLDLEQAGSIAEYFQVLDEFRASNEFLELDENVLTYLAEVTGVNVEELLLLYDEDGSLSELFEEAYDEAYDREYFGGGGGESNVMPQLPDTPGDPDIPGIPEDSGIQNSNVPSLPDISDTPDMTDIPDIPDAPDTSERPDRFDRPEPPPPLSPEKPDDSRDNRP